MEMVSLSDNSSVSSWCFKKSIFQTVREIKSMDSGEQYKQGKKKNTSRFSVTERRCISERVKYMLKGSSICWGLTEIIAR